MNKLTYILTSAAIAAAGLSTLAMGLSSSPVRVESNQRSPQKEAANDLEPDKVSDLKVTWVPDQNSFRISFKAPTRGSYYDWETWDYIYEDLSSISRIEVTLGGNSQSATLLHTFETPQPGEALEYIETSLQRGETYTFGVTVYAGDQYSETLYASNVLAGVVPATPEDIRFTSADGSMPFTLSFTAPSLCSDNVTPLESIVKGELWTKGEGWYDDPTLKATLPAMTPGERVEYIIDMPELTGLQDWTLTLFSEDGPSAKVDARFYVGIDTPGKVANLTATELSDGSIEITWDEPETGSRGGWYDRNNLQYDVALLTPGSWGDDRTDLASNLYEKRYVFTPAFSTPTNVRFGVYPHNATGFGSEAFTPYMILGPALELPFSETFDNRVSEWSYDYDHLWAKSTTCTASYPPEWRVSNYCYVGNIQVYPPAEEGGLVYLNPYSYTPESDFMLTSPKIAVEPGGELVVNYKFYAPGVEAGNTYVAASLSFDGGATFTQVHKALYNDYSEEGWTTAEATVSVPSDAQGVLLRMTAHNSPEAIAIVLDDIRMRAGEAIPDVYPASVSDFTASLLPDKSGIEINLTAPSLTHPSLGDINNEPLSMISRISLQRQIGYNGYEVIHEFLNPTPGETLQFIDTDIAQGGEYYYKAIVYVGDHCDYGNYIDQPLTLGQIPADASELTLTSNRGNSPVTISFRLPSTDWQGETLTKISAVLINIYNTDALQWETLATLTENLVPGEIVSYNDTRAKAGETYEYRVICVGTAGSSYGVNDYVYVGLDEPERPANLVATVGEDGLVTLTWEAPSKGVNHGYIDTEHLTYTVQRGNAYSDYNAEMLQSGILDNTYTDPTTFGDEEVVKYFVKATSGPYTGYSAISNLVIVGDPSELPYEENFNTQVGNEIQPNHPSWLTSSTEPSSDWSFAEMAYFIMEGQILPVDRDGGLAYAYYGPYSSLHREDYLTSGNLNVEGLTQPGLVYNFYAVEGYDTALRVEVSFDGGEFTQIKYHDYQTLTGEGWNRVEMPVDVPAGAKRMQVRFTAIKGDVACSVALDNVKVVSKYEDVGVNVTPLNGVMVAAVNGNLVIKGLDADEEVRVTDLSGRLIFSGRGDLTLPVPSDIYLVTLRNNTLKLRIK